MSHYQQLVFIQGILITWLMMSDQFTECKADESLPDHVNHLIQVDSEVVYDPEDSQEVSAILLSPISKSNMKNPFIGAAGRERLAFGPTNLDKTRRAISSCHRLRAFCASATPIDDEMILALSEFDELTSLVLAFTTVTDKAFTTPGRWKQLVDLDLAFTKVTDSIVPTLLEIKSLRSVDLSGTNVTESGMQQVVENLPLRVLRLRGTRISAELATSISKCRTLRCLIIQDSLIPSEAAEAWKRLQHLEGLFLHNSTMASPKSYTDTETAKNATGQKLDDVPHSDLAWGALVASLPKLRGLALPPNARLHTIPKEALHRLEAVDAELVSPKSLSSYFQMKSLRVACLRCDDDVWYDSTKYESTFSNLTHIETICHHKKMPSLPLHLIERNSNLTHLRIHHATQRTFPDLPNIAKRFPDLQRIEFVDSNQSEVSERWKQAIPKAEQAYLTTEELRFDAIKDMSRSVMASPQRIRRNEDIFSLRPREGRVVTRIHRLRNFGDPLPLVSDWFCKTTFGQFGEVCSYDQVEDDSRR